VRPTIADVAREAGVSTTTVSHALNGTRPVADETQRRILEAVERLQYEVNSVAQSLKRNRSHAIGLLITDIGNPFFTALVRGIEDVANRAGYSVFLCNTDEDPEKELTYLRMLTRKRVDGIVMAPTGSPSAFADKLIESGFPLVCIDRASPGALCDCVLVDNVEGARVATSHLIGLGHQRVGVISGLARVGTSAERLAGYRQALAERGIPFDERIVLEGNSRPDGGFRRMLDLLDAPSPPTALFVTNNLMTLGALGALGTRGVRVPDDLALIGFDDFDWATILRPRLTAVAQPTYEIGEIAAGMVLDRIRGDAVGGPRQVVLHTRLIVRETCGAAGAADPAELEDVFGRPPLRVADAQTLAR
jgi:LacI family transcriptional regulator